MFFVGGRSKAETEEMPEFTLTKAVEDVSQKGYAQIMALQEKQQELSHLQAILADVEKRGEEAQLELRSKMRHIFTLEDEMEYLERQTQLLHAHCVSLHGSNMELQLCISEDKEKASIVLAEYNTYRKKMEGHRAVVQHAESQTEAHKELEEKRALVQTLTHRKEALRKDLENPNGETMQFAKREIEDLKGEISVLKRTVAEKRERLLKESDTHSKIKKEIEIQNKRYEAIVKRLRCQLNKAQAIHRQMSGDICHMERQVEGLKRLLESEV
ncbi:coiled-coil domain-containing protein 122 [Myripristis murdjan]|uniref:coiled-coil domain-containing protein 122 n=1 Tax=Myripristis murdjan TaxID=586833 RepID=UPI0011762700|nr:coiled-coil domain-containing protein 122 [Myripristis murdjan]